MFKKETWSNFYTNHGTLTREFISSSFFGKTHLTVRENSKKNFWFEFGVYILYKLFTYFKNGFFLLFVFSCFEM